MKKFGVSVLMATSIVAMQLAGCGADTEKNEEETVAEIQLPEMTNEKQTSEVEVSEVVTTQETVTGSSEETKTSIENSEVSSEEQPLTEEYEIDEIVGMLENSGDKQVYETLYEMQMPCINHYKGDGTWNRTNIHNGNWGSIVISDTDDVGFKVNADASYFSHTGYLEVQAYFINDSCAIAMYDEYSEEEEYIAFIFDNDSMMVKATATSMDLGLGMNVSIWGEYTKDEPVYTNANIMAETYTQEELAKIQEILPTDVYEEYFVFATECGLVQPVVKENGMKTVQVIFPTMASYGYVLEISDDGNCTITFDNGDTYTN